MDSPSAKPAAHRERRESEVKMRSILTRKSLVAGAVVVLVVSILHSQTFRADVFGWSRLLAWYLASLLVGGAAGCLAGLLLSRIPARLNAWVAYAGGALLGMAAYSVQVYLFLLYVFRHTVWE